MSIDVPVHGRVAQALRASLQRCVDTALTQWDERVIAHVVAPQGGRWSRRGDVAKSHKWFFRIHGDCRFHFPDGDLAFADSASVLVPRGVPHRESASAGNAYRSVLLIPAGSQLRIFAVDEQRGRIGARAILRQHHHHCDRLEQRLDSVVEAARGAGRQRDREVHGLQLACLALLADILDSWQGDSVVEQPPLVRRCCQCIENRAADSDLTVAGIAAELGVHPDWLTVQVRRATGFTPRDLLLDRRLTLAREGLSDHRTSIADVALASGFRSVAHFSQIFRQRCGRSPSDWRRFNGL